MSDASGKRSVVQAVTSTDPGLSVSVRCALASDAAALADLINDAYAIERFFVDGDRTNAAEIRKLGETGTFLVLEYAGGLAAAVYVEPRGYFGMLAVLPGLQGHGLGRRLVGIAEALCEATGCATISLKIVNVREELGRWYRSLGSLEIGTAPYEHRPVKRPCHFVEMRKVLRPGAALDAAAA